MTRLRLERIARLLDELEQVVGPDRVAQAFRRGFVEQLAERTHTGKDEPEGDPQPHIDHQVLERVWALDPTDELTCAPIPLRYDAEMQYRGTSGEPADGD
jgi:hypothetical protein